MGISARDFIEREMAGRWIAGPSLKDAIERARQIESKRMEPMINYLGEAFGSNDRKKVGEAVRTYEELISLMAKNRIKGSIAVKPTQLGLLISYKLLERNYSEIVKEAEKKGIFVWLDMEESKYVDDTIKLYKTHVKSRTTGICIQSYLKRSENDIKALSGYNAVVRLVKGAYKPEPETGFTSRAEVTENYARLMRMLFETYKKFTIATHDTRMITEAMKLEKRYKKDVSFAMLNGIRNGYAESLASKGYNIFIYLPFGREWVSYAYRRLREASNFLLLVRSILSQNA